MTTLNLLDDLKADEGLKLQAYPDPKSGGSPWTIGYGHTGLNVHPGLTWTQAQAEQALGEDVASVKADLDRFYGWWRGLSDIRQDALVNMTFNLGIGGLRSFKNMLWALRRQDFQTAAQEMLNSEWAREVPRRAARLAEQMKTGERPTPAPASAAQPSTSSPQPAQGQPAAA